MKCYFCGGSIVQAENPHCLHCGRSVDVAHELRVQEMQKKEYQNFSGRSHYDKGMVGRRPKWEE